MKALKPEIPTAPTVLPVIIDMQSASGVDCHIILDDTQILFYPILPCLVEELTIVEKSLELSAETNYVRKSMRRSRALFAAFERGDKRIGVTFQGFLNVILRALAMAGKTLSVTDGGLEILSTRASRVCPWEEQIRTYRGSYQIRKNYTNGKYPASLSYTEYSSRSTRS